MLDLFIRNGDRLCVHVVDRPDRISCKRRMKEPWVQILSKLKPHARSCDQVGPAGDRSIAASDQSLFDSTHISPDLCTWKMNASNCHGRYTETCERRRPQDVYDCACALYRNMIPGVAKVADHA